MNESNFLFVRIDNRLVHGQVGITWCAVLGADIILVADDEVANDVSQQTLMLMAARASHSQIKFLTLKQTVNYMKDKHSLKIFLVVKTPAHLRILLEKGLKISEVNIGNMHYSFGKHQITKKVYVDDKDMEDIEYMKSKDVHIYIQDIPGDTIIDL